MTISYYIRSHGQEGATISASILPERLKKLCDLLHKEGARMGLDLLSSRAETPPQNAAIEARIGPLALASLARAVDFDEALIGLFDEAQFRGRCLLAERNNECGWTIHLSSTADADHKIAFAPSAGAHPA
jgi:hypothetical protein